MPTTPAFVHPPVLVEPPPLGDIILVTPEGVAPPPKHPLLVLFLSPLAKRVIAYMLGDGPRAHGGEIGRGINETSRGRKQASTRLRECLRDLGERGVLTLGPGGYALSALFLPWAHAASS